MNVFHAFQQHANGQRQSLAIKVIFPCQEKNFREVECLLTLASHPNIVQIMRSEKRDIPAGFVLYIIMELCGDKNMQDYLNENRDSLLDYDRIMSFSKQLVDAVKHIHRNNIVHRDLKPENILLLSDGEHLKVTDFGISKELRDGQSVTKQTDLIGTDGYRAPETLRDGNISKKADIFSLGIMLALLWSNWKHAYGEKVHSRNHNILENIAPDLSGLLIPGKEKNVLCSLLRRMLSPDPFVRPTIEEVFRDAFFTVSAIQDLLSKLPRLVSGEAEMNGNGTLGGLSDLFQNTSSRRVTSNVISSDFAAPPATEIVEMPSAISQNDEDSTSENMNNDLPEQPEQAAPLPAFWEQCYVYYIDHNTRTTTWQRPNIQTSVQTLKQCLEPYGVEVQSFICDTGLCLESRGKFGGKSVTIKKYEKDEPNILRCFANAAKALKTLKHKNIVCYLEQIPELCVVIVEYFSDRTLLKLLLDQPEEEGQLMHIAAQVASGMAYIHGMGYVHCGLMAANVSVDTNMLCKISDFSYATYVRKNEPLSIDSDDVMLPIRWTAPEIFTTWMISRKCDIWSYGILLWEIFTGGQSPCPELSDEEFETKVCGKDRLDKPKKCPEELYQGVIRRCWSAVPDERPTFAWLEERLFALANKRTTDQVENGRTPES